MGRDFFCVYDSSCISISFWKKKKQTTKYNCDLQVFPLNVQSKLDIILAKSNLTGHNYKKMCSSKYTVPCLLE